MQKRDARNKRIRATGAVSTGLLLLALFYIAGSIFAPVAFALFVIALVWPLQRALQERTAKLVALLITLSATISLILAIASAVASGSSKVVQWLNVNSARFQTTYGPARNR